MHQEHSSLHAFQLTLIIPSISKHTIQPSDIQLFICHFLTNHTHLVEPPSFKKQQLIILLQSNPPIGTLIPQDIMKNKNQNHTTSKFILQTRCPHFPFSMNAELVSKKQSKHTHYFEQHLISVLMNNHIAPSTASLRQKVVNLFNFKVLFRSHYSFLCHLNTPLQGSRIQLIPLVYFIPFENVLLNWV